MRYLITGKHADSGIEEVLFTYRGSPRAGIQVAERLEKDSEKSLHDFRAYKLAENEG
jgi:hypothetical protein